MGRPFYLNRWASACLGMFLMFGKEEGDVENGGREKQGEGGEEICKTFECSGVRVCVYVCVYVCVWCH